MEQQWFEKLTPVVDGSMLHMGNESSAPICGIGMVNLEFIYGMFVKLYDVILVHDMCKNFVSGTSLNFLVYVEHSKAYRFYVMEYNDWVSVHIVTESLDAMFNK